MAARGPRAGFALLKGIVPADERKVSNILDTITSGSAKSLSAALKAGDTAAMNTAYTNLQAISSHVNTMITTLGGWEGSINNLKSDLTSLNTNLSAVQATTQGVDYPTAITGFTKENTAQQASLQVMAKMNTYNLFDYLA